MSSSYRDFSEVVPGLFVGSKPPPGRQPFDVIVLAAAEYQPSGDLFPDTEVLQAPLLDEPSQPLSTDDIAIATSTAARVARRLRAGKRVLVSCLMGLNRSALIAALAMQEVYKMPLNDIFARLRNARGPWALSNPTFVRLLRAVIV